MKRNYAFMLILVLLGYSSSAQFKFLPDPESQIKTGTHIAATSSWPFAMPPVEVNKWSTDMLTRSTWENDYQYKSVLDVVKIGIDQNDGYIISPYKYKVNISIDWSRKAGGTFVTGTKTCELYISYDPLVRQRYTDLSVFKFSGAHTFTASITSIFKIDPSTGVLTALSPSDVPANFFIESEIIAQRYDKTPKYISLSSSKSADGRNLVISGGLTTSSMSGGSGTSIFATDYKPAAYELEWTYIDDYEYDIATGTKTYKFDKFTSTGSIDYDFRKNSTRVQLDYPSFNIPLIYEHGAIIFRMRMLRPKFEDYKTIEYGPWTLPDHGAVSTSSSGSSAFNQYGCLISNPHTDDSLNWQYTINFAEQGKYKHVINYFDGSLKDRQTQTKINSNQDKIIAVEKVYDYEGRPSIVSLPTPVTQDYLYYRNDILVNDLTNKPYKASDFDDNQGCGTAKEIPKLASSSVANIYYSTLNPDKSDLQKFVPDAEGFPMVQTIYSPDNTNKVEWQGAAGKEQQLSEGHGTRYEYVRATQTELDKYLGTEAGQEQFYPKQIVTDPNGQSSYSILNPQGKVVISGLQGSSPNSDKYPISQLDNFVPGDLICNNLLKNGGQEKKNNTLSFTSAMYNDGGGTNTLNYNVTTKPYKTECGEQYLWAKAYFDIAVSDNCGIKYDDLSLTGNLGSHTLTTTLGSGETNFTTTPDLSYNMPKGKFMVDKKLYFSEYDIRNQVRGFIKANEPICFSPEAFFIREAVEATNFPCKKQFDDPADEDSPCDLLREQMIKDMYPEAKYGKYTADAEGKFKKHKENSIFSLIQDLIVPTTETTKYEYGRNEKCNVPCSTSSVTCSDGREGCSCSDGAHVYPDFCCETCLVNHCKCISFPLMTVGTPSSTLVTKYASCRSKNGYSYDREVFGWETPSAGFSAFGQGSEFRTFSALPPATYYYVIFAERRECTCGVKDTIWSRRWYKTMPKIALSSLTTTDGSFVITTYDEDYSSTDGMGYGKHNCLQTFDEVTIHESNVPSVNIFYRYQADCINYPAEIWHQGKKYVDIKKLDPQTFIKIFNREMAEALLPLHPEYCKLKNCELFSGTFEKKFSEITDYHDAEAAGLFNLNDIVNADPLPTALAGGPTSTILTQFKNTFKYPFTVTSAASGLSITSGTVFPLHQDILSKQSLAQVYCGAGNYDEMQVCANTNYKTKIDALSFDNEDIKQKYFTNLQTRYLNNRNLIKQYQLDNNPDLLKNDCETCPKYRMTLVDKPHFASLSQILYSDGTGTIGESDLSSVESEWRRNLYNKAFNSEPISLSPPTPTEVLTDHSNDMTDLADAEAEAVMMALKDCPIPDKLTLKYNLKNAILSGNKLTPDVIRASIIASATGGTAALNHLCHPFLMAYGLLPNNEKDIKAQVSNYACGEPSLYDGLKDFLNYSVVKSEIANAHTTTMRPGSSLNLSLSNPFDAKIIAVMGLSSPYTIGVLATAKYISPTCTTGTCGKYVNLCLSSGCATTNYFINIQSQDQTITTDINDFTNTVLSSTSDLSFTNPQCINNDSKAGNYGVIAQKTAVIDAQCTSCPATPRYYVWSGFVDLMTPAPSATTLENAITCVDIKRAIDDFLGTDQSTYAYSVKTNHPLYQKTILNYLNFKFNKQFNFQDYQNLMEGCALSDKIDFKKEIANARLEFTSEAAADAFETNIKKVGPTVPDLFRYKLSTTANPIILVNLAPVNSDNLARYYLYMQGAAIAGVPTLSGVATYTPHYTTGSDENLLFTRNDCSFSFPLSATPPVSITGSTGDVLIYENNEYRNYKLHVFAPSSATATPKDKADIQDWLSNYLHTGTAEECKIAYEFWGSELLRSSDYTSDLKQYYLSYIYGLPTTPAATWRSTMLTNIDPLSLGTHLGSAFSASTFTYDNPYCLGSRNHLYAYNPSPATWPSGGNFDVLKTIIIPSAAGISGTETPFPDADKTTKTAFDGTTAIPNTTYNIYRKANGMYWYQYFDANHKMYNVYIAPPDKLLGKELNTFKFNFSSFKMGPDKRTFTINAVSGSGTAAVTVNCLGYTSFDLLSTNVAENVILFHHPSGTRCLDSIDCEYNLLENAIANGKANYYKYFEENVTRISNDYLSHLLNTTKETLTFCTQQQQYQQTLYYYDRVGNLVRTVPPMGVQPLTGTSLTNVDKYRDGTLSFAPETYTPGYMGDDGTGPKWIPGVHHFDNYKLTNHNKISYYKYNSLNQLVYQKTPDGGITYFFYDAAGRQIFSQNSKQRKDGIYSYSIYDAQGRPEESGQVVLGCKYKTDVDYDLTPCEIYYKRRDLHDSDKTYFGSHPDFVESSYDETSYPYENLKFFIRNKSRSQVVRTYYDNMTEDLGAIAGEMLSTQENLRSRVAAIKYYNSLAPDWYYASSAYSYGDATFSTYYSYDMAGNVQTIAYDYPELMAYQQRYKRVDYDYDLVSGKVNMISYNRGYTDQFYQQYDYDADNRITKVKSSNDGLIWNRDAEYQYYQHGPLARLQLGNQKVQSLEYAYTIQGWLKAINGDVLNPNLDMGKNGLSADMTYPRDVVTHALRYFNNDYKPIGTTPAVSLLPSLGGVGGGSAGAAATTPNLYNGNISHQSTGIEGHGTMLRTYQYDQLQRLKLATNTTVDDAAASLVATTPSNLFKTSYSYDMDGNISNLSRWNGETTPVQIDNFSYKYQDAGAIASQNNKLLQVEDISTYTPPPPTPPAPLLGGIDLQTGQPADNYSYDKIGNLIRDKQGAEHILWDRFGKVSSIRDTAAHRYISFAYDGKGNRIWKKVVQPMPQDGGYEDQQGEYYVRDAGGNILSVYRTRSKLNRPYTFGILTTMGTVGTLTTGGSIISTALADLTDRSYPAALMSLMHSTHPTWVSSYTTKPISYYWAADPTLKSNLLFSGEAWIDQLRIANPSVYRDALISAGRAADPLFFAALGRHTEGRTLLQLYSTHMPPELTEQICQTFEAQYDAADHAANAANIYAAIAADPSRIPLLVETLVEGIKHNAADTLPHAANLYNAIIASDSLWLAAPLRAQNGPWTAGIRSITNNFAAEAPLLAFFDTWPAAPAALDACTTPEYKLSTVYEHDPATALKDMAGIAGTTAIKDILADMPDLTTAELGEKLIDLGATEIDVLTAIHMGTSGDTISLAEHHLYGSSRLGVQRYDSTTIANILNLPEADAANVRTTLRNRTPWYSYSFADLIDSTKRDPYAPGLYGNAYLYEYKTSRTLGRRYYEMTDHLGNVLATVLDRKTGAVADASSSLYDHWVADLASTADYYPGGMMMPGRNTEYSWSRMAYNGKPKDDEVYGKGNFQDYGFRSLDNRIMRFISEDPLTKQYPWYTPYQFAGNSPIEAIDLDGLEEYHTKDGNLLGKYGNNTEIRIVYDDYVKDAVSLFQMPTKDPNSDALNNALYNNHSAGVFKSADAAANDWAVRYNPQSIQNNQEYMSFIFSTVINNQRINSYTEPSGGTVDESKATWSNFTKARLSGSIHSHGAYLPTYDNNNFSSFTNPDGTFGDIQSSDKLGTTDYLSTPNGSLKRYNTLGEKIINQNIPSDPSDPDRKNNIPPIAPAQKDVSSE